MKKFLVLFSVVLFFKTSTICGEVYSRAIDTAYRYWVSPAIAIGPNREVVILFANEDTVFCYVSTDNGRTFIKSSFDHHWEFGYNFEFETGPADVAFDRKGNLYLFWCVEHNEDLIDWQYYRVARSTDGGKTFTSHTIKMDLTGLMNSRFSFDNDDNVVLLGMTYGYCSYTPIYFCAAYSIPDSIIRHSAVLAIPDNIHVDRIIPDVIAFGDSVDAALIIDTVYAKGNFYNFLFPNNSDTVQPTLLKDTTYIHYAKFLSHSSQGNLLATVHNYSSLMTRIVGDSSVSEPFLLKDNIRMYDDQPSIQNKDSSIFFTYYRYRYLSPDSALCFYQMHETTGEIQDSIILPGHRSPGFALDSLDGKYLVSIYQNKLYLTTKDVILKVGDKKSQLPSSFLLSQNWPNPWNPSTTIHFELPHESHVTLKIYNLLGQEIQTLVNDTRTAGTYNVQFDAAKLTTGVYFYRLQAGAFMQTKKMVVIK